MKILDFNNMIGGWFIGNFEPTAYKTTDFEVCYKTHPKGEKWDVHYHKKSTEINLLIKGKMTIQDKELRVGDIFIIEPYEIANPEFLEDCLVITVKTPSDTKDKYIIK